MTATRTGEHPESTAAIRVLAAAVLYEILAEYVHKVGAAGHGRDVRRVERLEFLKVIQNRAEVGDQLIRFARFDLDTGKLRQMLQLFLVDGRR